MGSTASLLTIVTVATLALGMSFVASYVETSAQGIERDPRVILLAEFTHDENSEPTSGFDLLHPRHHGIVDILAETLDVPAAFAQNQTEDVKNCAPKHRDADGVCELDEVESYKFSTTLLNMYREYNNLPSSIGSDTAVSGTHTDSSAGPIVSVHVLFKEYDCSLPDDLGIVHKSRCSIHGERASMGVRIPVGNLYDLAAVDHVNIIYPDEEPDPDEFVSNTGPKLAIDTHNNAEPTKAPPEDMSHYIALASIAAVVVTASVILYTRKRMGIEA